MKWQECFEKYNYDSLIYYEEASSTRKLDIEMFLSSGQVPEELREIYLSPNRDELFLILQPKPNIDVEKFCTYWDSSILAWIQFGQLPGYGRDGVKKLKYNITMVLLYGGKEGLTADGCLLMERPTSFSLEKSTSISRKIFLKCEENDVVDDDSILHLPFWYEPFELGLIDKTKEDELSKLLLMSGKERCLLIKKEKINRKIKNMVQEQYYFTEEEFLVVKGWLES